MTSFIPKERSAAYRPWQLKSLEGGGNKHAREREDAERIKMLNQQAYKDGYEAGYVQGAARAAAEAQRLAALVGDARQQMLVLEQRIAEDLVRLALTLARALVREALKVHPELIEAIVRETVRDVPPFGQSMRLRLNPDDAALIDTHLCKELGAEWSIVADPNMARGGCRVETASCEIDATLEARWLKLTTALAQEHEWLA